MDCLIRIATSEDAIAISRVVCDALRETNAKDYTPTVIDLVEQSFSPEAILHFLTQRQVYVATIGHQVVELPVSIRTSFEVCSSTPPIKGRALENS